MNVKNFVPNADRVLIEPIESANISGVVTLEKGRATAGLVIAVGEGFVRQDGTVKPMAFEVGQEVVFSKAAGVPMQSGGKDYLVIQEGDIMGHYK